MESIERNYLDLKMYLSACLRFLALLNIYKLHFHSSLSEKKNEINNVG